MGKVNKRIGYRVAKMAPVSAALEAMAKDDILPKAKALAAQHRLTGQYQKSLKARRSSFKGVRDWIVYSDDPQAVVIEYGSAPHVVGKRGHPGMRGLYILTRAAWGDSGGSP